jgi:hypothetical protein
MSDKKSSRSEKEVADIFSTFENQTNIFSLQIDGVSIWQQLRFTAAYQLQNISASTRSSRRVDLVRACVHGLNLFGLIKTLFFNRVDHLFLTYYSGLRSKEKNLYKDVYVDDYLSQIKRSAKIIRFNAGGFQERLRLAKHRPLYDLSLLMVLVGFLRRLFAWKKPDPACVKASELIVQELGLEWFTPGAIQSLMDHFFWQSRIYRLILSFIRPIACYAPDTGERALIHACHKKGIRFVEIQHGIYSINHPDVLPLHCLKFIKGLILPDFIALYGKHWVQELAGSLQSSQGLCKPVGNPTLESFQRMRLEWKRPAGDIQILVLTTNGIDTRQLAAYAEGLLKTYGSSILLNIKLHPAFDPDADAYRRLEKIYGNVRVIAGNEDPSTFELIAKADLHMSIASACHYDSLAIGTPTAIIPLAGHELVMPLVERRQARLLQIEPSHGQESFLELFANGMIVPKELQESFCSQKAVQNLVGLTQQC